MGRHRVNAIRALNAHEVGGASAILEVAGQPRVPNGPRLWSKAEIDLARCLEWQARGELFGGFETTGLACVFCLHDNDTRLWPEGVRGEALYLHKLAVRQQSQGLGWTAAVIMWAAARAKQLGSRCLRLDTVGGTRLVSFYEIHGFRLVNKRPFRRDRHTLIFMELPI